MSRPDEAIARVVRVQERLRPGLGWLTIRDDDLRAIRDYVGELEEYQARWEAAQRALDNVAREGSEVVRISAMRQVLRRDPDTEEPKSALVVDYSCSCGRCTSRTEERYRLPFGCHTCGTTWIGEMRRGDRPPLLAECPGCGGSSTYHKAELVQPPAAEQAR